MWKRGALLVFISLILINVAFMSAFEVTGKASLDNSVWDVEFDYPNAQFTTDAGITPDSFLYFAEDLIFSRFRSDFENREVKVAEVLEMTEQQNPEAAMRSLERYERYASETAREVSPDQIEEVASSAVAIRRAVSDSELDEESMLEILNWEGSIITSAESAVVIRDTCTELSSNDPLQYSLYCQSTEDSPGWFRNLDRNLVRQQQNEIRLFGQVISQCIQSSGANCDCASLSFEEFSDICMVVSSLVSECENGEEASCENLAETLPAELLNTEMPSYLEGLYSDVEGEILQVQIESNYIPNACQEQSLNSRACREYLEENRDTIFPIDPTPRVPPLDPSLPPKVPKNDTGRGGGSGGGGGGSGGGGGGGDEPPAPEPDPIPVPAPTLTFSASPTSIMSGSSSTLTWSSTNANSCTSSGGWSGLRTISGVQVIAPTTTTTYTLTCSGDGGSASSSVTVTVTTTSPPPPPPPPPSGGAISSRSLTSNVAQGVSSSTTSSVSPASGSVVLVWVSQTNPTSTNIPTITGLGTSWTFVQTAVRADPGPRRLSVFRGTPTTSGTLTLNYGGNVETAMWSVVEYTGVDTTNPVVQTSTAAANVFETSALTTLPSAGQTGSATAGGIFNGGAESLTPGSGFASTSQQSVGTSTTGNFRMLTEFKSSFDSTIDASWATPAHWVALGVELRAGSGGGVPPPPSPTPAPTLTFSASPTSITSGSSSTLTWSSTNANSCTGTGGAFAGSKSTSGTQSVNPTATTSYTLSCTGDGGTATSSVTVTVTATNPPPPPPSSGDCDITVNAASVSGNGISSAVNSASSGQTVCLVGSFDLSDTYTSGQARDGVNQILFDVTTPSITVDGSGATVTGNFQGGDNIALLASANNVQITGFTIRTGFILVGYTATGVVISNNDISESVSPSGNFGLIRSLGDPSFGTRDLTITGNYLHDMYTCGPGSSTSACSGVGSNVNPQPWNTFTGASLINGAAVFKEGVDNGGNGAHYLTNNRIERVPALFTFKRAGNDVGVFTGNTFGPSQWSGRIEGNSLTLSGNTYSGVTVCNDCWATTG